MRTDATSEELCAAELGTDAHASGAVEAPSGGRCAERHTVTNYHARTRGGGVHHTVVMPSVEIERGIEHLIVGEERGKQSACSVETECQKATGAEGIADRCQNARKSRRSRPKAKTQIRWSLGCGPRYVQIGSTIKNLMAVEEDICQKWR